MSLATMLLAFVAAIVRPKMEPEKSGREVKLEAELDELKEVLRRVKVERDSWRRRCEDAQAMLARVAGDRIERRLEQRAQYQDGAAAVQAAQYAQAQQLAAQQNMANPLAHAQMLQAMNQQLAAHGYCNCVPARHDMLLGAIGGV